MNERIQKLIDQATITNTVKSEGYMGKSYTRQEDYFDKEKFAQLIILECADIAYKTSWDDLVHGYGQAVIPIHLHNTIKEHFGVKE